MKKLCVVGNPIKHSLSPELHAGFAKESGVDVQYDRQLIPFGEFKNTITKLVSEGYSGFSVTVPFKEDAYALAAELSDRATLAEAVNTLYLKDNTLCGDNTDGAGLIQDLKNHAVDLQGKKVLVLGAGGAAKGIMGPLSDEGAHLTIANRTLEKATTLAQKFNADAITLDAVKGVFDVVINATSAGLVSDAAPWTLGDIQFGDNASAYDLVYQQERDTAFVSWAKEKGAKVALDGYGMLVEQAKLQFELFTGKKIS